MGASLEDSALVCEYDRLDAVTGAELTGRVADSSDAYSLTIVTLRNGIPFQVNVEDRCQASDLGN